MWYMRFVNKNSFIDYWFRKAVYASIIIKLKCRIQKDTEYYIIRKPHPAGFFSDYFFVLGHCMIAQKLGLKPCVDMETVPSLYSEECEVSGTRNAWEYYFKQDNKINEALNGEYIVCEEKYPYKNVPYYATTCLGNEGYPNKKKVAKLQEPIMRYATIKNEIRRDFDLCVWGGGRYNELCRRSCTWN